MRSYSSSVPLIPFGLLCLCLGYLKSLSFSLQGQSECRLSSAGSPLLPGYVATLVWYWALRTEFHRFFLVQNNSQLSLSNTQLTPWPVSVWDHVGYEFLTLTDSLPNSDFSHQNEQRSLLWSVSVLVLGEYPKVEEGNKNGSALEKFTV